MSDKKITDKDYLFLSSLLRAREAGMLSGEKLEQMLAAGSFTEAAKLLAEAGWPDVSDMDRGEVDNALSERRENLFAEIARITPEPEAVDIFRIRYDYHNAKSIIKGEAMNTEVGYLLSGAGRVAREKLEEAFREDDYRFVPAALGHAMQDAKSLLARTGNPQMTDFLLDRACYGEMSECAEKLDNSFITGYVRLLIDGANLRTALRCTRMQKDAEFMKLALISGGSVSVERVAQAMIGGEGLVGAFGATAYKEAAALGADAIKGGRMTAFELECDNTVNRYLKDARMKGFGPEPVVGFLAAEENNITAVRLVLTGFLAGIEPEKLKERLRDTYA